MKKVIIAFIALLVLGAGGWFTYQHFSGPQKVNQVKIVALGDSLTEGVGDTTDKGGYTGRIKTEVADETGVKTEVANFGKSGDRSDQILKRLNASDKQQNTLRKADVILMTVGGNDLMKIIKNNIFIGTPAKLTKEVETSKTDYENNLEMLLNKVRALKPDAPIFLFGNYNPLYVYFANFKAFNASVETYNSINQKLIKQYNGYYVPTFKQLTYGQFQTAKEKAKLVSEAKKANSGIVGNSNVVKTMSSDSSDEKNMYISGQDHFHPNNKGYNLMTKLLFNSMMKHDSWLYVDSTAK